MSATQQFYIEFDFQNQFNRIQQWASKLGRSITYSPSTNIYHITGKGLAYDISILQTFTSQYLITFNMINCKIIKQFTDDFESFQDYLYQEQYIIEFGNQDCKQQQILKQNIKITRRQPLLISDIEDTIYNFDEYDEYDEYQIIQKKQRQSDRLFSLLAADYTPQEYDKLYERIENFNQFGYDEGHHLY
jgi:hypothetical protein